MKGVDFFNH